MKAEDAACTSCPLFEGAKNQLLHGDGPKDAKIMLVGEAPGEGEDAMGKPFVGRSGKLLNDLLARSGLKREEVFVTNAVRCRPTNSKGENRKPTSKEVKACQHHLIRELAEIEPEVIITLGNEPLKTLTGLSGVSKYRGEEQEFHKTLDGRVKLASIVPTFHPSYALRYPENEATIVQDITTAVRNLRGGFTEIETPYVIWTQTPLTPNMHALVWSWDIETNAREMHDPALQVWFMSVDDGDNIFMFVGSHVATAVDFMLNYINLGQGVLVGHNASDYDRSVIKEIYKTNIRTHDTQLLAQLIDETQSLKLQDLCVRNLGIAPWKEKHDAAFWYRGPQTDQEWADAFVYNARDTRYTRLLYGKLCEMADDEELRLYREHNLPASRALATMQRNGAYIDVGRTQAAIAELETELRGELQIIKSLTRPDLNPASHQQVRELLFNDLKFPSQGKTDGDENSTDVTALKKTRSLCRAEGNVYGERVCQALLNYRSNEALVHFPISFLKQAAIGWTEKKSKIFRPSLIPPYVFPHYSMTSTDTGRTSSFNPNMQQTPRDKRVRSCVAAPPGYVFIQADGSQMEMRFGGEFAGPESALFQEYLKPNPDVHMTMAMRLTHKLDPKDVTKKERDDAKPPNFSFLYNPDRKAWRTYQRIALDDYDLEVSDRDARIAHDAFLLWGVKPWWDRMYTDMRRDGYIRSIFGRKRRLPNIHSTDEYWRMEAWRQGCNAYIQSAASDYFLIFLTVITGMGFHVVGAIHDAAHVLCPDNDEYIEQARAGLRWAFEVETPRIVAEIFNYKFRVPLTVDVEVGRFWGDKQPLRPPVPALT